MNYEEALGVVTSLCENWKTTHSNYTLEEAVFKTDANALHARVQALFDNIFPVLSEGTIRIQRKHVTETAHTNALEVRLFGGESPVYGYKCQVPWEAIAEGDKETFVDNLIKFLIERVGNYVQASLPNISLQRVSKIYGYLRLIELDIKESSLYEDILTEIAKEKELVDHHVKAVIAYRKWCEEVTKAIENAGNAWFSQNPEIVPGMKVVILDLRSRQRAIKTVRSTSKRSAEPIVRFTDGSYVYTKSGKIDAITTWILQHEEFKEVVDTCNLYFS